MPAIIGRHAELAEIDRAVLDARAGRGRLLLVSGPAGIGKSRLATASVETAHRLGLPTAIGHAVDDPGAPPLWPWTRVMRGWAGADRMPSPDIGEADATARFRLFVAITDVLRARAGKDGLLVVLEDMHWADRLSVLLLRHVLGELSELPVAIVTTARETTSGPLHQLWPELVRGDAACPLPVDGLSAADVAAWLPALGRSDETGTLAVTLRESTAGNPLLIRLVAEDLVRSGARVDALTVRRLMNDRPQLRRLVVAKLDPLDRSARDVLDGAAVLGDRVDVALVAAVADAPLAHVRLRLDQARSGGVLRDDAHARGLHFEHALVRDAVYADIPFERRAQLHRRAAIALESGPDHDAAGSIAYHWQRAAGADALGHCARWAERADDAARAVLAFDTAVEFARLALASARDAPGPGSGADPNGADGSAVGATDATRIAAAEPARLTVRLAEALFLANRLPDSIEACVAAADLAETAGRPDLLAQAALVIHGLGDPFANRTIPALCERALALLPPHELVTRARLKSQLAVGSAEADGGPRAAELAAAALAEAEACGDPQAILEAIAARHLAISIPHSVSERLELGRRAIELASSSDQPIAALWGRLWRLDAAFQLGNMAEVDRGLAALDRVARERSSALARWHHLRYSAVRGALLGEFDAARSVNDAARDLAIRMGDFSMLGMDYAFRLELAFLRGSTEEIPPEWEDVIRFAPPMPLVRVAIPLTHAIFGDLARARAEFEEFRHLLPSFPVGVRWAGTVGQIAKAAVVLDDAEVCAQAYELFLPFADQYAGDGSGGIFSEGAVARLVGDFARVAGRPGDALAHYRNGVSMNARIGARPFAALSRLGLAQALIDLGHEHDPSTGESVAGLLAHAGGEFHRLDMPGPLSIAAELVARIPRAAVAADSPLTTREREVVDLLAQGLTNKTIAQRLFLSERTVETHVRNVLAKLDLSSRTEIAVWALRR